MDYLRVRADGRFDLHIHAEITTDDGQKISLHADGVALPRPGSPVAGLRENVTLFTSSKAYAWVNRDQLSVLTDSRHLLERQSGISRRVRYVR